ncbi:hypothetical protein ACRAWD_01055 [Caulobacter segnis]
MAAAAAIVAVAVTPRLTGPSLHGLRDPARRDACPRAGRTARACTLGGATTLRVRLGRQQRDVTLVDGEASFEHRPSGEPPVRRDRRRARGAGAWHGVQYPQPRRALLPSRCAEASWLFRAVRTGRSSRRAASGWSRPSWRKRPTAQRGAGHSLRLEVRQADL